MGQYTLKIHDDKNIWGVMKHVMEMIIKGLASGTVVLILTREQRSKDQNSKLWPMLQDIQRCLPHWHGEPMGKEDYKDLLTASFKKCRVVPNTDSTGFVIIGLSTSKMRKAEFSEFIEFIYAFGAERNVQWSESANEVFNEYRQVA